MRRLTFVLLILLHATLYSQEQYRPQFHFSPKQKWTNDPNGMLFYKGLYHLFFQYYPDDTQWGPMHWGHATSTDMMRWTEQPIALYPDSLGYIFSGSAVVDSANTSGFGKNGKAPLVAIFTHHDPNGEKEKRNNFQVQSIAYSLDEGKTWTKFSGNPVLKNPGITDFRDPKVSWYAPGNKWIMTLATKDRITFYSSKDLKNWSRESQFGAQAGAHGGVWECPDLFPLQLNGKEVWVLLVSINPGGPNGGSVTQYFTGTFNGNQFTANDTLTKWMDYGPDNYAGVTFSNLGPRRVLVGWMTNWRYAGKVPTKNWRGAFTIPRELSLKQVDGKTNLVSKPVKEMRALLQGPATKGFFESDISASAANNFKILLTNSEKDSLIIGYDRASKEYYIDRSKSGEVNFDDHFTDRIRAARISNDKKIRMKLVVDVASVEVFADDGLTVMTAIFFPKKPFTSAKLLPAGSGKIQMKAIKGTFQR